MRVRIGPDQTGWSEGSDLMERVRLVLFLRPNSSASKVSWWTRKSETWPSSLRTPSCFQMTLLSVLPSESAGVTMLRRMLLVLSLLKRVGSQVTSVG